jgi:protein SCO1/2
MSRRSLALLFALAGLALVTMAFAIRGATRHAGTALPADQVDTKFKGASLPPGLHAPDFALRDEDGKPVTMREYRGHTVVVTFLYSHCKDTCPVEAQQIKGALDDLGSPLPVLAISVDPPNDTPASIRHFDAEQGVTGRIRWVVGTRAKLKRLWKAWGVTGQTGKAEHVSHIMLVDRHGVARVGFPAQQTTPESLAHDLRVLERE